MFRKIITYFLILAVVLPVLAGAVPLPVGGGVNRAQAADATEKGSSGGSIEDPCGAFSGTNIVLDAAAAITAPFRIEGSVWDCFSYTIVNILYTFVMNISIWIAGLAGDLFNVSIQFSLTGESFDADKNIMIKDGWTLVRDLLNLIFIFILLFAAISTILQYGNMDIKKILPSLIVVALLVNFSMMIAKMVIDASHIFAWEFYNQIDVTDGGKTLNMQNSVNVDKNFEKKHLANVFMAGFNPQKLLIAGGVATTTEEEAEKEGKSVWKQVVEKSMKEGETLPSTLWRMAIIILLESALAIFAAFILFAGAIMFVLRVVVLWLVIIFSPIAFLGMILPKMGEYSGMWWKYLIGQSFFAPAFLFMFMLATKFINSKLIESLLKITPNNDSKIATGLNMGEIILILFNFLIVGVIMMACLIVAKKLGAETAQYGMKWAHKGKDLALGGAKKLAWGPARYGLRYGGGAVGDSDWFAQTIGRIPGGNILGRKLGAMRKADEDKARKAAEKYAGTLSSAGRKSLASDIEGKGFMKRFMYTGPEGAFKPGKEGYEKIIEKKKGEEDERKRIAANAIELMGSHVADFMGIEIGDKEDVIRQKIEDAKEKAKGILLRGNMEELDKYIEMEDKKTEESNKKKIDEKNKEKRGFDNKIKEINDKLTEARKWGNAEFADALMKELEETEDEAYKNNKKLMEIVARGKHRENLQKIVDKYEGKQNIRSGKPEEKKEKKEKSE